MSGQKANPVLGVARGVGQPIAFNSEGGGAAEWIMLLPAAKDGLLVTVDGRGPYRMGDVEKLAAHSLERAAGRLPIDENHATDLAAPKGGPSPARGWVTQLDARADGLYGHVEWSASGAAMMSERAYRFISPVFTHDKAGNVNALLRASLTNTPNLRGMAALHAEGNDMDLLAKLRQLLGLADDADEAAILAKVEAWSKEDSPDVAMQSVLAPIAKAAGLKDGADVTAIQSAVTSLAAGKSPATDQTVIALQTELAGVTTSLNAMVLAAAKDKATAFVDGAIAKGHVGVKPMRDTYIAMHAADPAQVEKLINAMPILGTGGLLQVEPPTALGTGEVSLNAEQQHAAKVLGVDPKIYAKKLAADAVAAG